MDFTDVTKMLREDFPPFIQTHHGENIYEATHKILDKLIKVFKKVEPRHYYEIGCSKNDILHDIALQKEKILEAINAFSIGNIVGCYETIFKHYFYDESNPLKVVAYKKIPARGPLFRLRYNANNKPYTREEMFHIPFDKVHLVTNQRFSISGYPCLYLGTSFYGCWEELDRPDMERCNVAVYRNERDLNMVDLNIPLKINTFSDLSRIPLIIACALKLTEGHHSFKSEYIIPQSVFQGILRLNALKIGPHLDGILYISTKIAGKLFYKDENLLYNFVLPTLKTTHKKYCQRLTELFTVSEAVTYQELWLKYPQLVAGFDEDFNPSSENYSLSIFSKIEKFVCGKTVLKAKIKCI
jgi:hypothetical protein